MAQMLSDGWVWVGQQQSDAQDARGRPKDDRVGLPACCRQQEAALAGAGTGRWTPALGVWGRASQQRSAFFTKTHSVFYLEYVHREK